ncbi:hypothetical protein HZA73_04610 [candidate division TA06 bacterium]|nr:hypothetical protein [candidate division TA06 bacterium]
MTERQELYARLIREGLVSKETIQDRLVTENAIHYDKIEALLDEAGIRDRTLLSQVT